MVRAIRRSVSDVQQMTRLVEDLLDRSQLQAGKFLLRLDDLDLVVLVGDIVHRATAEATAVGSTVVLDAPSPVAGKFDPVRITQVVANLLSNAIKYGAGKPVTVSVRESGGSARIAVTDGGPGITQLEQEHIFERFERGTASDRAGSYGLGLWIVRELVLLHGGTVTVQSAPGHGATFTVVLPLC